MKGRHSLLLLAVAGVLGGGGAAAQEQEQEQEQADSVASVDVSAWNSLHAALGGDDWAACGGAAFLADPCACSKIVCASDGAGGALQILELNLADNNLRGELEPALLSAFPSLTQFDFADNPWLEAGRAAPWDACVDFSCGAGVSCTLPSQLRLCADTDLAAWRALYDGTAGDAWVQCAGFRDDPCGCGQVFCEVAEHSRAPTAILKIVLPDNGMAGEVADLAAQLPQLRKLVLTGNPGLHGRAADMNAWYGCAQILERCVATETETALDCRLDADTFKVCALSDLGGWKRLFDTLKEPGFPWRRCATDRSHPCGCELVECNGRAEITGIQLYNANLRGELPVEALQQMRQLQYLRLNNLNPDSATPNVITTAQAGPCLQLARCHAGFECLLPFAGASFCPEVAVHEPDAPASVHEADLTVWRKVFDATGGPQWNKCAGAREDPCGACFSADERRRVICADKRIVKVVLQNNRLDVDALPTHELKKLPALNDLRLTNPGSANLNVATGAGGCFSLPRCADDWFCRLPPPAAYCHLTKGPTPSPTAFPTRAPTQRPTLAPGPLDAWRALYDSSGGGDWLACSEHRDSPCACHESAHRHVLCGAGGGITSIVLRNNNLRGVALPVHKFGQLDALTELRLDNPLGAANANAFSGYGTGLCVDIPQCAAGTPGPSWACALWEGAPLCSDTPPPTLYATAAPTMSGLVPEDAAFWRALWDALDGAAWAPLACPRDNPCACTNDFDQFVRCRDGRLVDIVLPGNGLAGELPLEGLRALPRLERVVLSGNDLRVPSGDCLELPECSEHFTLTCDFSNTGLSFCAPFVPTKFPTSFPTARPTAAPTTPPPTSATPTQGPTRAPSAAPTAAPTISPRDLFVTIRFPRGVFSPSVVAPLSSAIQAAVEPFEVVVRSVRSGSIVVDFVIANSTDGWSNGEGFRARMRESLGADPTLLDATGPWEEMQVLRASEDAGFPTPMPTLAPSDRDTRGATSLGEGGHVVDAPVVVASVFGSVCGLSVVVFLLYKHKPKSQRAMDRKASFRLGTDENVPIPFKHDATVRTQPPPIGGFSAAIFFEQQAQDDDGATSSDGEDGGHQHLFIEDEDYAPSDDDPDEAVSDML